ncbi:MAG: LysE family transporter, partial [Treponemataceae bacterium]|nr:LysE family transporter [Treponemataceae bacterium]
MPIPGEILPSFLWYCYLSAITPGPANLCSLSLALRRGRKDALCQWTGIFAGFFVVAMASVFVAYFVGAAAGERVGFLSFVGAAYLAWLSVRMVRQSLVPEDATDVPAEAVPAQKPAGFVRYFLTGMLVQLTNVKVMLLCLTALTSYVLPYNRSFGALFAVGLFLPLTGPVANLVWLFAGVGLQRFFARHTRAVALVMAASLLL